jgi:YVTN family beta-propeller protein
MMNRLAAVSAGIAMIAMVAFGQIHREAYVMNGLAETLDVIDLQSGSVSSNAEPLGLWPNQIIYQQGRLVIINSGYNDLQIIDPITRNTIGTVEFGADHNPYYMCPLNDSRIAVTQLLDNSVSLVNISTQQEDASIPVGSGPEGIIQEGNELYITMTNYAGGYLPGMVYVINLSNNQVTDSITVGINPQWIGRGLDGNLHVVCTGDYMSVFGEVDVISPANHQVEQTIALGSSPGTWAVMESGIAYLGVNIWGGGGYLLAYDTQTYQVLHSEANPLQIGGGVMGVTAGEDGKLYICVTETDQIKVMDSSETIVAAYNVGDGPQSLALSPVESSVPGNNVSIAPDHYYLGQNFPNPFNGVTSIPYALSDDSERATLDIVNVTGQLVRRYVVSGAGTIIWDGTNQQGIAVAAGPYWARLSLSPAPETIRMIYLP